ncbi:hypothetical protein GC197_09450 [bacterium]|nr:hypothetical protein [bacterium]
MKKLDLQNGGLKAQMILHVEKLVFGLVILLVVAFVYFGTQQKSISTNPDELDSASKLALANINEKTWDKVEKDRWVPPEYQTAAARASKPIPLPPYETPSSLKVRHKESIEKRADPKFLALENLEVVPGFAPFALISSNPAGGTGIMPGMRPGAAPGSEYDIYSGAGMPGELGMNDENTPPVLTLEQTAMLGAPRSTGDKIQGTYFIAITGLAPLKKQLDLYNAAFKDRAAYLETRDYPRYVHFAVERREQKADGSWSEWEKNINVNLARQIARYRWAFSFDEVAPPEYLDPVLTFPIPPILLFNPDKWARHSTVPLFEPTDLMNGEPGMEGGQFEEMPFQPGGSDIPGDVPLGMMPGGMDGGPGMMPGSNPGMMPGMPGYGRTGMTNQLVAPPGTIRRPTGTNGGMMGPGMGGGMGMEGGGASYANSPFDAENKMFRFYDTSVQPNKTYQYRVQLWLEDPNNPQNLQEAPSIRALEATVVDRVKPERDKVMQQMQGMGGQMPVQATNTAPKHQFWRTADYSEPSPAVRVPSSADVLAGSVKAGRLVVNRDDRSQVLRVFEPTANVLAMIWDPKTEVKALVTKEVKEVRRGEMVHYEGPLWVLDPTSYTFRRPYPVEEDPKKKVRSQDEEYSLQTGYTLLDMRGGEDTAGRFVDTNKTKLKTPGEVLVLDDAGHIHIKSELGDLEEFIKFNFAKPEVKRKASDEEDPMGEDPGMYEDYGDAPGGSGSRKSRRNNRP